MSTVQLATEHEELSAQHEERIQAFEEERRRITEEQEKRVKELQEELQAAMQKGDKLAAEKTQVVERLQKATASSAQLEAKVNHLAGCEVVTCQPMDLQVLMWSWNTA